ncbi:hypothetical protein ACEWY4_003819 [Coilia grayii]|uniref:Uncharacterized protein n=1 Tax=Coilia grayii TaxID=363190 RepID=A0ABD1KSA7_9TELE
MWILSCLSLALKDMSSLSFLLDIVREFLGTALFLLMGLSSTTVLPAAFNTQDSISHNAEPSTSYSISNLSLLQATQDCHKDPLQVALAFAAALVVVCVCMGAVQLNPALTLALALGLRLNPWRAMVFVAAQLLGALAACAILMGIVPTASQGQLGLNEVVPGVLLYQAVSMEMAVTFQLVFCGLAVSRPSSTTSPSLSLGALAISVMLGNLTAIGYTGCGMNPARSFGPAMVKHNFHNHWVYWVGPCAGAVLAWLSHDVLLWSRWSSVGDWINKLRELVLTVPQKHTDPEHIAGLEQET